MDRIPPIPAAAKGALAVIGAGAGLTFVGLKSIYNVEPGHRAIVYNRLTGVGDKVYGEGTHFKLPWLDRPILFNVRTRPRAMKSLTGSRDLQMVDISCRVLSRPDEKRLSTIYRTLGHDHDEKVLPSLINEVLKSVVVRGKVTHSPKLQPCFVLN
eukprot:GHVN01082867.1.p1 GENE.GHVN01082867.1~~GHVN01082867.1.p1  ORF type:complete len:155 (+),score=18.98 GHVN01082867.1:85-549(+)